MTPLSENHSGLPFGSLALPNAEEEDVEDDFGFSKIVSDRTDSCLINFASIPSLIPQYISSVAFLGAQIQELKGAKIHPEL